MWLDPAQTSPYQFRQFWVQARRRRGRRVPPACSSLRPLDEVERLIAEHEAAPERRLAQRALADELTELVHGPRRPRRRRRGRRRAVRRRSRPRRPRRLAAVAGEVPVYRGRPSSTLGDAVELLVATGLASLEERRPPAARAGRRPGQRRRGLGADGRARRRSTCSHGRFLLLRKGKRHVPPGRDFSDTRLTLPGLRR